MRQVFSIVRRMKPPTGRILALGGIAVTAVVLEGLSVIAIYPTLAYVERGGDFLAADPSPVARATVGMLGLLGLKISLSSLLIPTFVLQIARQVANYGRQLVTSRVNYETRTELQLGAISAYLAADVSFFHRHNRSEIFSAAHGHASRAAQVLVGAVDIAMTAMLILVYIAALLAVSPWLSLAAFGLVAPLVFAMRRLVSRGMTLGQELTAETIMIGNRLHEDIQAIRIIKVRGMEATALARFQSMLGRLRHLHEATDRSRILIEAYTHPLLLTLTTATFYVSVAYMNLGLASLGVFVLILMRMIPLISQFNLYRFDLTHSLDGLRRYEVMVDAARRETTILGGAVPFPTLRTGIRFDQVGYAYQTDDGPVPALSDVSFEIRRGETIAFVGRSGAGKSTLADMIPRFLDPDGGRMLFDGIPSDHYDLVALRRSIAFVSQDTVLFDESIRNNINFGLDQPLSDVDMAEILRAAHCAEFIDRLPNGIDTVIGDRGMRLSGGQRQRLAIARALACRPEILVLDEPTSALDSESEGAIQDTLHQLRDRLTIIIIAHRLATIRSADKIAVLDQGRLIGFGAHEDLLETTPTYRRLFEMQMSL